MTTPVNIVPNGNFEDPIAGASWTTTGLATFDGTPIDGSGAARLGSPTTDGGATLETTINTVAGVNYTLNFDYQEHPGEFGSGYMEIYVGGDNVGVVDLDGDYSKVSYSFTGTGGPTTLSFQSFSDAGTYLDIDNVTVTGDNAPPTLVQDAAAPDLIAAGVGISNQPLPGVLTSAVHLTIGDPDADDSAQFVTDGWTLNEDGTYSQQLLHGTVTLEIGTGTLTYTLNGDDAAVRALAVSETLSDDVTVTVADTHGATTDKTISFTIDGANDAPVVAAPLFDVTAEDGLAITRDLLTGASDPDQGETFGLTVADATFSVDNGQASVIPPAGVTLVGGTLVVDPTDPAFQHLALGQTTVITAAYNVVDLYGASVQQTASVTVVGTNDAPVVAAPLFDVTAEDGVVVTRDLLAGASDPDQGETFGLTVADATFSVDNGQASVIPPAGVTLVGGTLVVDPTDPAFQHLAVGQSTVITAAYNVVDVHGASVQQTASVTVVGTNDAPVVAAPLSDVTAEDGVVVTRDLLTGASDPDQGETFGLTVADATFSVDNGQASVIPPAGVTLVGGTLVVDPTDPAFQHLALGQTTVITAAYNVVDLYGASVQQTASVTVVGTNDAPVVAAPLFDVTAEDGVVVTRDLLAGASDPDQGETFDLTVADATFSVDNGQASVIPPAGVTLVDGTLVVDPTDPAFQHLAVGQSTVITAAYNVVDVHGASVQQTASVTVVGTNDAPVVAAPLFDVTAEDGVVVSRDLLTGASDPDQGETFDLTVADATFSVDNGQASVIPPAGVTLVGGTLVVDPTDPAFQHLAVGQSTVITAAYNVVDVHGASVQQTASVTVFGTNDAPVVTSQDHFTPLETQTTVGSLTATDIDDGDSISYAIGGQDADLFTVDPQTGVLSFKVKPDVEAQASFTLQVTATDQQGIAGAVQTVTISLQDAAPELIPGQAPGSPLLTPENTGALFNVNTGNGDLNSVSYMVSGAQDGRLFQIDGEGNLSFKVAPDYETPADGNRDNVYVVTVNAADDSGNTTIQTYRIQVTDVLPTASHTAPVSLVEAGIDPQGHAVAGTPGASATITLEGDAQDIGHAGWTDSGNGTVFTRVLTYGTATLDTAAKTVSYALDNALPATQALHVGQGVQESVNVVVTDGHGATYTMPVTFEITGTNDASTLSAATPAPVVEAGVDGQGSPTAGVPNAVVQLTAGDVDSGDVLAFDTAGWTDNHDGTFSLDLAHGRATLVAATGALGYALDNANPAVQALGSGDTLTDAVTVTVGDGHGGTASRTVEFSILGANDAPHMTPAASFTVPETATVVGTVVATDVDAGDHVTYVVTGGQDAALFTVNPTTGVLSFIATPDFEAQADYAVQVTATDTHGVSTVQAIAVTLQDVSPLLVSNELRPVAENTTGTILDVDAAGGDRNSVAYTVSNASDGRLFQIDAEGRLSFKAAPDYEAPADANHDNVYVVTVNATDDSGNGRTVTYSFQMTDVAPTVTAGTPGPMIVDGPTAPGVGTAATTVVLGGDAHGFDLSGWTQVDGTTYTHAATYGTVTLDQATGALSYALDNAAPGLAVLGHGMHVTDTVTVPVTDGHGSGIGHAAAVAVPFVIYGTDLLPTITAGAQDIQLVEAGTDANGPVAGTAVAHVALTLADADLDDVVSFDTAGWIDSGDGVVFTQAANHGMVALNTATGQLTYTLDDASPVVDRLSGGAAASDQVTVTATDGIGGTTSHTVTFNITGTNDAPVVVAVNGAAVEDGPAMALDALAGASDVDGDGLTVVDVPANLPAGVSYEAATHSLRLDPTDAAYQSLKAGEQRTVAVEYGVSDGTVTTAAHAEWVVTGTNDAPVVAAVNGAAVEDGQAVALDALAGASDVDGDSLAVVDVPAILPAGVSYEAATHSLRLDPTDAAYQSLKAGEQRTVAVEYGVSDGTVTTAAHAEWVVTGTNDAPVVAAVNGAAVEDGQAVALDALAGASDVDGDSLAVVDVPAILPAGVSYEAATHSLRLDPTDAAYQSLKAGEQRTVAVEYGVSDGTVTTAAHAEWVVTGTNDAPVVVAVNGAAVEDGPAMALDALAGASDVDGDGLTVVDVPANLPAGVSYEAATHSLRLDPTDAAYQSLKAGEQRTVAVEYGVSDGTVTTAAHAEWVVTGTNDAPVVAAVNGVAVEDGPAMALDALAGASDVDGDTLAVVDVPAILPAGVSYEAATHSLRLDPTDAAYQSLKAGEQRTVAVEYGVSDGTVTTAAHAEWVVTGTNDAPVVAAVSGAAVEDGEAVWLDALAGASDVDGDSLAVVDVPAILPAGVSYEAATHSLRLDPTDAAYQSLKAGEQRTVAVEYGVSDGTVTTAAHAEWVVTGTNDAPVVAAVSGAAVEDGEAVWLDALAGASDVDGDTLAVVGLPANLPAGVSYEAATHSLRLDPTDAAYQSLKAGEQRTVAVEYGVSDGTVTTTAHAEWVVTGTNDAPVVAAVSGAAVEDGEAVWLDALAGASDVDGDSLAVVDVPAILPAGVSYEAATHSLRLDPTDAAYQSLKAGEQRTVAVEYGVSDGTVTTTAHAEWVVTGTNDAPVVAAVSGAAVEDGPAVALDALAGASDVDGDSLTVVGVPAILPAGVSYEAATHSLRLDPADAAYQSLKAGEQRTVAVEYSVSDGTVTTAAHAEWVVTGTNDVAVISGTVQGSLTEDDASHTVSGTLHVQDADAGQSAFQSPSEQALAGVFGSFTFDHVTGAWTYTLDNARPAVQNLEAGQTATEQLTVSSADGSAAEVISVAIHGVNNEVMPASHDFSGDGLSDLVLQNSDGTIAIWQLDGPSLVNSKAVTLDGTDQVANPGAFWTAAAVGDFGGHGQADIVLQGADGSIALWKMHGEAVMDGKMIDNPGTFWKLVGAGDFTGDGHSDIVLQGQDGSVAIWTMQGDSLAESHKVVTLDAGWQVSGTGDFDGDGKPDLLLQGEDGMVAILKMDGQTPGQISEVANPGTFWKAHAIGDVTGNGKSDIMLKGADGTVALWDMDGTTLVSSKLVALPGTDWHLA